MNGKNPKKSSIPKSVLHQVNEWTSGGYVIFFVNKDGQPEGVGDFDNEINMMGLHQYMSSWIKAAEEIGVEDMVESIIFDDEDDDEIDEDF